MNYARTLTNWRDGGNNYVKRAASRNKWVGFQESIIEKLRLNFGDDFFLVLWGADEEDNDYFRIPFSKVKRLFTEEHKTTGKYKGRWTAIIQDNRFLMHSNSQLAVDISDDYGNAHLGESEPSGSQLARDLEAIELENELFEGQRKARLSSYFERNPRIRKEAIRAHGHVCQICGFDCEAFYGTIGSGYIEVHHLIPVCTLDSKQPLSPITDMAVVCANCHRMLHRGAGAPISPQELKDLIRKRKDC